MQQAVYARPGKRELPQRDPPNVFVLIFTRLMFSDFTILGARCSDRRSTVTIPLLRVYAFLKGFSFSTRFLTRPPSNPLPSFTVNISRLTFPPRSLRAPRSFND